MIQNRGVPKLTRGRTVALHISKQNVRVHAIHVQVSNVLPSFQTLIDEKKMPFYNHIILILAIHCEWDEWVLGECSAECGVGLRSNTRVKLVEEKNGGTCDGKPTEVVECKDKDCPGKYYNFP